MITETLYYWCGKSQIYHILLSNYENGPAFNAKELKEYVNMIINGTLDEFQKLFTKNKN